MSVEPVDFLQEARQHLNRVDEIGLRTAVSRGYYAAYHLALGVCHYCPEPPPLPQGKGGGDHQRLIRQFESVPRKGFRGAGLARQIAALLAQGREQRNKADYRLNETISRNDAQWLIANAERIEKLTQQLTQQQTAPP